MRFRCRHNQIAHSKIYVILFLLLSVAAAAQQDKIYWNQFRGPNGQGVAQSDLIPFHFGPDTNVLWRTTVPPGHSSPVIWDNHIFFTASDPVNPKELVTLAINREKGKYNPEYRKKAQEEMKVLGSR